MIATERRKKLDLILAVDGSEHSLAATQLVSDLPLSSDSVITALAVLVLRDASGHAALEGALNQACEILQKKGLKVRSELLTGRPADELAEYADRHRPELVVLGAKGLRATLGILLGGVVQQMVEYGDWPVLVVRAPYTGLKRVLLVTDGSEHSQRALNYLAFFPLPAGVQIHLAHVLPPLATPVMVAHSWPVGMEAATPLASIETEKIVAQEAEEEERVGRALLDRTAKKLEDQGIPAVSVLLRGDAATEIIEYVKTHQIDLIVAGSRGLSQMKRLLLGSLSRKLVHYAGSCVLIVKGGAHVKV